MSLALETVVKQLADSGIVAPGKLENFVPPKASPKDAEELLRELFKQNLLTKFQAQQVAAGKAKALILGEYTILDKIGAGGMGQVFKAQHRRMDRIVAIKMLPPATTKDASALARFEREVRAAAKLEHPNIVTAHDAGQAGTAHFLVMQYVEGNDLSVLVKKDGPLSVDKAVNYILQAARGLEFAHGEGVIHRDIKPANLLLDKKGTVKILDMGLARIDSGGNAPTQAELTGTGAVMGTVDYMAPEQARSTHHADARADIYSLGCSLFYLLAARPLYDGDTVTAKLISHQFDPIPTLGDIRPDVPPEVQAVYEKMIAKKVEDRYQSMTEVIADLQACGMGPGGGTTMVSGTQVASSNPLSNSNLSFLKDAAATHTVQRMTHKHTQAVKPTPSPTRRVSKRTVLIGAGVLAVVLLAAIIIVSLRTKDGTLIVEIDQPDATVQVFDAEGKVEVTEKGGAGKVTISVDPGKHRLRVQKDGFAVFGAEFEMVAKGNMTLKARLEALSRVSALDGFSLDFDGTKSFVRLPIKFGEERPFTVEAFVRCRNSGMTTATIISNEAGNNDGFGLVASQSKWHFTICDGKIQPKKQSSQAAIEQRTTHIAGIFDGSHCRLFVDGMLQGVVAAQCRPSSVPLIVGGNPTTASANMIFDGTIDEVRISKTARYTGNFKPEPRFAPDADTVALYHFDEGSGDTAFDSSANKHHAKIVGAKWVKAGGSAISSPVSPPVLSSPATAAIPAEALTFGGHRYLLVDGAVTWRAAKAKAEDMGGHLATITTKEENDWIKSTILASLPIEKLAWIGGDKTRTARTDFIWTWITGEPWDFTDWGPKHTEVPDQGRAAIIRNTTYGLVWGSWGREAIPTDPMGQNRVHGYVVEWDTPATSSTTNAPPLAVAPFDAKQARAHQESWAKHLGIEVETTNSVGMKMVLIPPGEFMMGSTDEQVEQASKLAEETQADETTKGRIRRAERPQHRVVITKPFTISATEVTIGQFKKFSATGYVTEAEKAAQNDPKTRTYLSYGSDDLPGAFITWNDAVAYCQWLSAQEKRTYRLPTEAEWEYCCRAGTTTHYSFGDDYNELAKYGWHRKENSHSKSQPVGTLLPNPFGLFDMHGSLHEWCGDFYDDAWYSKSPLHDPNGPSAGSPRVIRGGDLNSHVSACRSASRPNRMPSYHNFYIGFRCMSELSAVPTTAATATPPAPSTRLFMHDPAFPQWMAQVQAMPAEEQIEAVSKKLMELNPGFDGKLTAASGMGQPTIANGVVTSLGFRSDSVKDVSPVRALSGLASIGCSASQTAANRQDRLSDLSPFQGMNLNSLFFAFTEVSDLSPLQGMRLKTLHFDGTKVADVSALRGMLLESVRFTGTSVSDLSPLERMPLKELYCHHTPLINLKPLEDCKNLRTVNIVATKVTTASVAALQTALPDCKIEWDDPAKATTRQPAATPPK